MKIRLKLVLWAIIIASGMKAQFYRWGVGSTNDVANAEFANPFVNAISFSAGDNVTSWTALSVSQSNGGVQPGSAYWTRSLIGRSQGAYWGGTTPVSSPSQANGVAIFDSDFLDNNGTQGAFGTGTSPSPHHGQLISPRMDLSACNPSISPQFLKFFTFHREFMITNLGISVSTDDGATWGSVIDYKSYVGDLIQGFADIDITSSLSGAANLSQCRLKFIFNGDYYFAIVDDISIYSACSTASSLNVTTCGSYTFGGNTLTATGVYKDTIPNALGCDSIITLDLTINSASTHTITETSCGSFVLNSQTYTSSGIYTQTLTNSVGCDSIITLDLTINPASTHTITETSCGSFVLNSQTYSSSGIYTQTLTNSIGCDSVITLNLTINSIIDQALNQSSTNLCSSGIVTINTASSETGIIYYLRNNSNDSIIDGPIQGTGSALSFNTGTISSADTFNVFAKKNSAVNLPGSNDLVKFNTPYYTYTNTITIESWVYFNGTEHAWAGQSAAGLDDMASNVWLWHDMMLGNGGGTFYVNDAGNWRSLNFPPITTPGWRHVATVADASGLYIYYDGVLVASNTSGIVTGVVNTTASVINLGQDPRYSPGGRNSNSKFDNFRVWNTARTAGEIFTNYQLCLQGNETGLVQYTQFNEGSGNTIVSVTGVNGSIINGSSTTWVEGSGYCESACALQMSQLINVDVTHVDVTVNVNSTTLTANATGATYQWIDCDNGNAAINGETNQSFTATVNGNYACVVTQNLCSDTTACNTISSVGLLNNNFLKGVNIFPNPSTGTFEINAPVNSQLTITNVLGNEVYKTNMKDGSEKINLTEQAAGIYFVTVVNAEKKVVIKLVKK